MPPAASATAADVPAVAAPRVDLYLLAHCACMLVVGLDLPGLSNFAMVAAAIPAVQHLSRRNVVGAPFVWRALLLVLALSTYYVLCVSAGIMENSRATALGLVLFSAFVAGYSIARRGRKGTQECVAGLLLAIGGMTLYSALTARTGALTVFAELAARDEAHVPSYWTGKPVTATVLGAESAIGLCLLPVVLLWRTRSWFERGVKLAIGACVAAALYANVVLQNRTPFLAVAAALVAAVLWPAASAGLGVGGKALRLAPAVVVIALLAAPRWDQVSDLGPFQRFQQESLETGRYDVWKEVAEHMLEQPWGGRRIPLTETAAHNLWLDIAWEAGPVAFALMVAFHASIPLLIVRALRREALLVRLVVLGAGAGFLFTAMAEPAMAFNAYTATLFYTCGLVLGLATRGDAAPEATA